jgi:hypothetical protein
MKRLATLLIGILLSINTFSQHFVVDEALIVEPKTSYIIELIKGEDYLIKDVELVVKKNTVEMISTGLTVKTKEVLKLIKEFTEDGHRILLCKDSNNNIVSLTLARNGILSAEYAKTFNENDIELVVYFLRK